MPSTVTVIGSATQDIETLLAAAGIAVSVGSSTDLMRFAHRTATLPRALVLDIRGDSVLPPALAVVRREHPGTGVIIVARQLDPALMLEAMRAGVTEWVCDPLERSELISAIERVVGADASEPAGQVFAVVGAKGGVGTTTVAANVATALAATKKGSTLLIDLHAAGGDAALFLGAEPRFSVTDALQNTHRLDGAFLKGIVVKTAGGLDLLASPDRATAEPPDPKAVRAVVECAMRAYRFVVLDVPRGETALDEALGLAASITIVATQEISAIRHANRIADAYRKRFGAERVRVVVNRYDRAAEIAQEDVERAIGGPVSDRFPSNYRLAIAALNTGRPIVLDMQNKLASALEGYARSLSGLAASQQPSERSSGLLGRLTGRR